MESSAINTHYYAQTIVLAIMEEPETFLRKELGKRFTLKENSNGSPEQHLGNKVSLVALENGVKCWSFSSS